MEQTQFEHEILISEWQEDSKIDRTKVLEEMYRWPLVHSKYLDKLQSYKIKIRKRLIKYEKVKALKTKYYNGEMSKEELDEQGWKQYLLAKPLKTQLETILAGDSDLQKIKEEMEYINILIESCESIMKEIHSRNFMFKNIVEMKKFEAGA